MADFGRDISTFVDVDGLLDLDPAWNPISGVPVVAEAIARRISTPPGSLPDDSSYGFDVRQLLEDNLDERDLAAARAAIQLQAEADERVVSATVQLSLLGERLRIVLRVLLAEGPFTLTLDVNQLGVEQLSFS